MELSRLAWDYFKNSGDIEFYILYQEMENRTNDCLKVLKEKARKPNEYR